jgi:1-acyl-sn-glycerol-3-phosphate acyltransferase
MKKYYHPLKDSTRYKRHKLFFKLINLFLRVGIGKAEIEWRTEIPSEPVVFVSNHTRTYAPLTMEFNFPRNFRHWAIADMLTHKGGMKHFYGKLARNIRPRCIVKIILFCLMPLLNLYFKSLDPIPVYHDINVKETFKKSVETLNEGMDLVIYPEKFDGKLFKYISEFQTGYVYLAEHYYSKTGKLLKFYPVYSCKDLKKIIIGDPIEYRADMPLKVQREEITSYLMQSIEALGDSLPEHKIYQAR